jgi:hypothetical protein
MDVTWVTVCDKVYGKYLDVDSVQGVVSMLYEFTGPVYNVHIELVRVIDKKTEFLKNCSSQTIPYGGSTSTCVWAPNTSEPAGEYCSVGWQYLPWYAEYYEINEACVDVHD